MAVEQQTMGAPTCWKAYGTCSEPGVGGRRVQHRKEPAAFAEGRRGHDRDWRGHLDSGWTAVVRSPDLEGRSCCTDQGQVAAYRTWPILI